jgi:hypothetical protein
MLDDVTKMRPQNTVTERSWVTVDIRGRTQKFPELLKKNYLKYLYKFESLVFYIIVFRCLHSQKSRELRSGIVQAGLLAPTPYPLSIEALGSDAVGQSEENVVMTHHA